MVYSLDCPELHTLKRTLENHSLYRQVRDRGHLQGFMESHVFAVWDFMSLLKFLQRELTCVSLPWTPPKSGAAARFVNEIVCGEESDLGPDGRHLSHFELYLIAMRELGADTTPIEHLLHIIASGESLDKALAFAPVRAADFVRSTFAILDRGKPHEVAAAFTYGREDLIPVMFQRLAGELAPERNRMPHLLHYLERHIEVDSGDHGPLAQKLLSELCGSNATRWEEARQTAIRALHARIALWDAVLAAQPVAGLH